MGPQGPEGESIIGPVGPQGPAGSPDLPKDIVYKLESLEGDTRLDKSAIKGIKEIEQSINRLASSITHRNNNTEDGTEWLLGGLHRVYTDSTLTGDGTPENPLHAISSGGGGGTPSLPLHSVQYNEAGLFAGSDDFIYDPSNVTFEVGFRSMGGSYFELNDNSGISKILTDQQFYFGNTVETVQLFGANSATLESFLGDKLNSFSGSLITAGFGNGIGSVNGSNVFEWYDGGFIHDTVVDFSVIGELRGEYKVLTHTTFTGIGLNDITFTGIYLSTGNPTYTFTVTNLNTQLVYVDDSTGFNVGDAVLGDGATTGTVIEVPDGTSVRIGNTSDDWSLNSQITDITTSTTTNIQAVDSLTDAGTFTDGSTVELIQPINNPLLINGINFSALSLTGHTINDFWTMTIGSQFGDMLYMEPSFRSTFILGDREELLYGNQFITRISHGKSIFTFQDSDGVYFNIDNTTNKISFPSISGGTGKYLSINTSGDISPSYPLALGNPIQAGSPHGILYADGSSKLAEYATQFFYNTPAQQFSVGWGANSFLDVNAGSALYRFGDIGNTNNGTKLYLDDGGMNIQFLTSTTGSLFMADTLGEVPFLIQLNGGFPIINIGANGFGMGTHFALDDTTSTTNMFSDDFNVLDASHGNNPWFNINPYSTGVAQIGDINNVYSTTLLQLGMSAQYATLQSQFDVLFLNGNTGVSHISTAANFSITDASLNKFFEYDVTNQTVGILGGLIVKEQYETPTTGSTITVAETTTVLTVNPSGALLALTITFPTGYDGRIVSFSSTQSITALTLSGGTFVGGLTTIGLGGFAMYVYSSGDSKWHRQG